MEDEQPAQLTGEGTPVMGCVYGSSSWMSHATAADCEGICSTVAAAAAAASLEFKSVTASALVVILSSSFTQLFMDMRENNEVN